MELGNKKAAAEVLGVDFKRLKAIKNDNKCKKSEWKKLLQSFLGGGGGADDVFVELYMRTISQCC